jgi:hypothetical protein
LRDTRKTHGGDIYRDLTPKFADCETSKEDGWSRAISKDGAMLVNGGKAFMRHGIKMPFNGDPTHKVSWLVGELNGVRCYFNGEAVVMTTEDLYP